MRATTLLALFCVVSLAAAETLGSARLRAHVSADDLDDAEFVQMSASPFGQNLINMLSLKFHASNGKLQVVLDLLDQLTKKLNDEQSADTKEYNTELARLNGIIKTSENKIKKDQAQKKAAEAKLKTEEKKLIELKAKLVAYQLELKQRNAALDKATAIRKKEHAAYEDHIDTEKSIIAGVGIVRDIISKLLGNNEVAQKDLKFIIDQLDDLKNTLVESIKTETAAESQAQANFNHFKKLTEDRITLLEKDRIPKTKAAIAETEQEIKSLKAEIKALIADIAQNRKVIAQAEDAIKTLKSNYARNTKTRSEQLDLIKAVKARLTGNSKNVQKYLNAA